MKKFTSLNIWNIFTNSVYTCQCNTDKYGNQHDQSLLSCFQSTVRSDEITTIEFGPNKYKH